MPDHLEQDMAIILLMICYLCYVQFYLQVYDEAKGMLIIVLQSFVFCVWHIYIRLLILFPGKD